MKKLRIVGLFIFLAGATGAYAQDIGNIINGSKNDINYLVGGYASPFIKAFGSGLNQGWYNTAAPHKFPGADLTISVSLIGVPSSDKTFYVDQNKLEVLQLVDKSNPNVEISGNVPTIVGSDEDTNKAYKLPDGSTADVPTGFLPIPKVPVPIVHLGIGLPKGTDIKIRYLPNLGLGDDLEIGMFGVGIMHDIKQWIPGIKNLPFSLSAFVGYTKFKTSIVIDKDQNQSSEFDISATTIQALVSKKIAVLTVYGGVGYDISNGSLKVLGSYSASDPLGNPQTITDPVDISTNNSSPRFTAGARLKLGPITFHGDYTARKYSAITAGFGISVR